MGCFVLVILFKDAFDMKSSMQLQSTESMLHAPCGPLSALISSRVFFLRQKKEYENMHFVRCKKTADQYQGLLGTERARGPSLGVRACWHSDDCSDMQIQTYNRLLTSVLFTNTVYIIVVINSVDIDNVVHCTRGWVNFHYKSRNLCRPIIKNCISILQINVTVWYYCIL